MKEQQQQTAYDCLNGAEMDTMSFPEAVGKLMEAGFESYLIDFRRGRATYYLPDGESLDLPTHVLNVPVAPLFDAARLLDAIREAQQQVAGYTYKGFCRKAASAGCASYLVSFSGRRALYIGRTGETHVEHFPD